MMWFNGKTDRLPIVEDLPDDGSHRMTPFAQGYLDALQLGLWDNPFTKDDEEQWWCQYTEGFALGQDNRRIKHE